MFRYKTIIVADRDRIEHMLNSYGDKGWRLHSIFSTDYGYVLILETKD
jgi:hypothetical protein